MPQSSVANVVLAVDDDPMVLELVQSALEEGGFEVACAGSASAAIAQIEADRARNFVALVTDVNLSRKLSGWDVARRARELNPALPVLYISGDRGHEWEAQGVPESVMLQKPYAAAQLVVAVATLVTAAKPID